MAAFTITNAKVVLASNDLSDHNISVDFNYSSAAVDKTAMGDGTHKRIGGLLDWDLTLNFNQDYAAGAIDSILFPLVGTTFTVVVNPVNSSNSTSNPAFSGTCFLESYQPISGSVGDLAKTQVKLSASGTLSRLTS